MTSGFRVGSVSMGCSFDLDSPPSVLRSRGGAEGFRQTMWFVPELTRRFEWRRVSASVSRRRRVHGLVRHLRFWRGGPRTSLSISRKVPSPSVSLDARLMDMAYSYSPARLPASRGCLSKAGPKSASVVGTFWQLPASVSMISPVNPSPGNHRKIHPHHPAIHRPAVRCFP